MIEDGPFKLLSYNVPHISVSLRGISCGTNGKLDMKALSTEPRGRSTVSTTNKRGVHAKPGPHPLGPRSPASASQLFTGRVACRRDHLVHLDHCLTDRRLGAIGIARH